MKRKYVSALLIGALTDATKKNITKNKKYEDDNNN